MTVFNPEDYILATQSDLKSTFNEIYCHTGNIHSEVYIVTSITLVTGLPMELSMRNIRRPDDNPTIFGFCRGYDDGFQLSMSSQYRLWVRKSKILDWNGDDENCI